MANNGYLVGDSCLSIKEKSIQICKQNNPLFSWAAPHYRYDSLSSEKIMCSAASGVSLPSVWLSYPAFDCEVTGQIPKSTIPTVADGITLGWQAGGALILVGCILFLKKVLK